ncbi:hypothetical protein [Entomohabitans teleogrylli]|uniref:hypothetical protein n=1 Tax=Entomohabitans teleogrylli TaxID=1384589 RepID=UPI00073D9C24|nr:hypothetical protein [Entomohabitans teleogrylli]
MMFTTFKRAAALLLLGAAAAQANPPPDAAALPLTPLIQAITSRATLSALEDSVAQLKAEAQRHPQRRIAAMFYGYGQLFIAEHYLAKKNYLRAAEASKQGFFSIDEAAESDENDWRMRFLRARMDAFVPQNTGRCVVALEDTAALQQARALPASLQPMVTLMRVRALAACGKTHEADAARQALAASGEEGERLAALGNQPVVGWSAAEMDNVILPLAEVNQ